MKRIYALLLGFLLCMFAGCAGNTAASGEQILTAESTCHTETLSEEIQLSRETISSGEVTVSTVDELLAAIGSDKVIILKEGEYDLTEAQDYGKSTGQRYYTWSHTYDGYELQLQGVENLTIRGADRSTTSISARSRYANVILMYNCKNVTLENITAGHTQGAGECSGNVLVINDCSQITLRDVGLYGCGVVGIRTSECADILVVNSDIYDCSDTGIAAAYTDGLTVENCRIYDLGAGEYGGSGIFYLNESNDVRIRECEIRDNVVQWILHESGSCENVEMLDNTFRNNRIRHSAFSLRDQGMTLDGNVFQNNSIRIWYDQDSFNGDIMAVDASGGVVTEEALEQQNVMDEISAELPEQKVVLVNTVDELLNAIASNTMIVLNGERYDLSEATGYGVTSTDFYHWQENHDGPGLVITGVDNLTLCSTDANVEAHVISADPRYAHVLTFSQCSNITVQGFTAGHTKEPGYCLGGVLCFRDCDAVTVDNCSLYGCGTLGVEADYSGNITVTNCEIYECSYGGIRMWSVNGIDIAGNTFRDLGGDAIQIQECKNVFVNGESVSGSSYREA